MDHKQFTVPEDIVAACDGYAGKMQIDFVVKTCESESQLLKSLK